MFSMVVIYFPPDGTQKVVKLLVTSRLFVHQIQNLLTNFIVHTVHLAVHRFITIDYYILLFQVFDKEIA